MRSTSDIKLAVQNVLAKYGYIMPKDLYLAIEDLHDEIESDRECQAPSLTSLKLWDNIIKKKG